MPITLNLFLTSNHGIKHVLNVFGYENKIYILNILFNMPSLEPIPVG